MQVGVVFQGSKLERQIELETEAISRGVARYWRLAREATARGDAAALKPVERLLLYWFLPLRRAIRLTQTEISAGKSGKHRANAGPVMLSLDADRLAVLAMHVTLGRCLANPAGDRVAPLGYAIGNAVIAEIHMQMLRREDPKGLRDLDRRFKTLNVSRINWWAKQSLDDPRWERSVCVQVGAILLEMMLQVCLVREKARGKPEEYVKAFERRYAFEGVRQIGVIRMTDAAKQIIDDGHMYRQLLRPRFLPMLVEPYKWGPEEEGGYIRVRTPLLAKPTKEQMSAFRNESTPQVYEGLNAINSTPWAINPTILRLQQQLWSEGGSVVGLPAADPLPLPPKPSDIAENKEARSQWKIEAHEVYSYNAKCQGQRAEFLQRLAVAEELAEEPEIYLPHQYDFRTRVYPIPVHLNHHQDSVGRSLLLFGRRVPVTDDGQRWLKINCANYYGLDKVPFDQRVNWVESHIDNLWEIFKNPIDRIEEWTKADKPWQYLAAICSLFDDDIAERMPVAVDGTCNGLQHYSAAGLDERGGAAVNLTPSDRPADVYSDVLEVVADRVGADARAGHAIAERIFGLLARNLVKAPVMTTPYNVTKVGARLQVAKELAKVGVGRKELYPSAKYLSEMVIDSIGDVCGKAIEIMKWIEDCVRAMCKHAPYETIRWTTPIGAPVVQPYRNPARHRVRTVLQDVILISDRSDTPVRLGKQVQGGPPNVVHSWDGTHNLSTAIECYDADIDYASVHDEYQAHASNIPQLNVILREQFILLHEQNLMGALHEEWSSQHPGLILPDPVTRGKLDLTAVMDSLYFFS